MILCDTGPLVALIDRRDADHLRVKRAMAQLPSVALVTTWPCLTEAMHLTRRSVGVEGQEKIWQMIAKRLLLLHLPDRSEWQRCWELMARYADAPMDLADASLVVAAERLNLRRVFTLDGHFHAYRMNGSLPFDVVP